MSDNKDHNQAAVNWIMGGNAENDGRTTPPKVTEQATDERKGWW